MGDGFELSALQTELDGYMNVVLGRVPPPFDNGVMTLMEFANTVLARLTEIEIAILRAEAEGSIIKGSRIYKFRTGELRTAQELFGKTQDLGSRRVTYYLAERDA